MTETGVFNALKYRTYNSLMRAYQWHNSAGQLHRDDGPAVEYDNGDRSWYQNGLSHRTDGPAYERTGGTNAWYQNGKYHRLDGPAIERDDGTKSWYIDGQKLTEKEFNQRTK